MHLAEIIAGTLAESEEEAGMKHDHGSRRVRILLNPVIHELAEALRFIGTRDRLRCPECRAVGTWKPHGGLIDRLHGDRRAVRRWMCKCCGLYYGPEGVLIVRINRAAGYWDFQPAGHEATPLERMKEWDVWPWTG